MRTPKNEILDKVLEYLEKVELHQNLMLSKVNEESFIFMIFSEMLHGKPSKEIGF